jgi:acetyltransferase-like isoleucine patch superfamily enzyme
MMKIESRERGRDKFNRYKTIINYMVSVSKTFPKSFRMRIFYFSRDIKGIAGLVIRYVLLKTIALRCGDNVSVHPGVYLLSPDKITIGNNVSIHPMCYIDAGGFIDIGDDVSLAHGVTLLSTSHQYSSTSIPIKNQTLLYRRTIIQNDVWIGAKSTVLYGRVIQEGAIVGANSLVNKDLLKNSVSLGVPAVTIKTRGESYESTFSA